MPGWTLKDIPSQSERTAVITGATSGIGYETALALAGAGARVIIASRNERKGAEVLARIAAAHPTISGISPSPCISCRGFVPDGCRALSPSAASPIAPATSTLPTCNRRTATEAGVPTANPSWQR